MKKYLLIAALAIAGNALAWGEIGAYDTYSGAYAPSLTVAATTTWTYFCPTFTAKNNRPWEILIHAKTGTATLGYAFVTANDVLRGASMTAGDTGSQLLYTDPPVLLGPFQPGVMFGYRGVSATASLWYEILFR